MAGIYIHIPYCKQACHYCDFHFSTNLQTKEDLLNALLLEIERRSGEPVNISIQTIYLGGGTPSILTIDELNRIFDAVFSKYRVAEDAEITLEANPDDLTRSKLVEIRGTPVNRFSIGVQSFFDEDLQYMNRVHRSKDAESAIKGAQDAGFGNITMDLIYGTPGLTLSNWYANLTKAIEWHVPHISAYALTVENDTPLFHLINRGKLQGIDEEILTDHYYTMIQLLRDNGFEQYEISNFAKPGFRSKHNSSYWSGEAYLGFGPSAHSYDGDRRRRWNVSNNMKYIGLVTRGNEYFETEIISDTDSMNEFLLTRLRLIEGINLKEFEMRFGMGNTTKLIQNIQQQHNQHYLLDHEHVELTDSGKLISDRIISNLFF